MYLCLLLHDTQHAFRLLYLCWLCCMIHNMHSDCCLWFMIHNMHWNCCISAYCCMITNMHSNCCISADSAAWYTTCIHTAVSMLTLLHIPNMHSDCCIYADSAAWHTTCNQTAVSMLNLMHDTQHAFKLLYLCWLCCMIHTHAFRLLIQ